ncbi:MAG: DUF883 family protein [Verrucomicrobiota bacterium]|jgi:ElaB/YqjD/DUF883 family membrane-anchored ribosome-binding protein
MNLCRMTGAPQNENLKEKGTLMETHFDNIEKSHSALARERVLADLKSLVRDSEDLLKATAGDMSEKAKDARARVSAALERARSTCETLQEQTVATARAAAKQADTVIRQHPYESIGIAFGVGLLIGVLVTRK